MKLAIATFPGATKSLIFDGLSDELSRHLHFMFLDSIAATSHNPFPENTAALVVVREAHHPTADKLISQARQRGLPWYYFCDDNFWLLGARYSTLAWYETDEAREILSSAAGIIVSSSALAAFVVKRGFSPNVYECRPLMIPNLATPPLGSEDGSLVVAFQGGAFRNDALQRSVAPALRDIARYGPVTLLVRSAEGMEPIEGVDIAHAGFNTDFERFIRTWRIFGPHVVVHPHWNALDVPYKTANAILISRLLGAVPIVGDEPPYAGFGEGEGVLKVGDNPALWTAALHRVRDAAERRNLFGRLVAACDRSFDPSMNEALFRSFLELPAPLSDERNSNPVFDTGAQTCDDTDARLLQAEVGRLRRRLAEHRVLLASELAASDHREYLVRTQQAEMDRRYYLIKDQEAEIASLKGDVDRHRTECERLRGKAVGRRNLFRALKNRTNLLRGR